MSGRYIIEIRLIDTADDADETLDTSDVASFDDPEAAEECFGQADSLASRWVDHVSETTRQKRTDQ